MPKRPCTATTKLGAPCKAYAIGDGDKCVYHSPRFNQVEVGRTGGLKSGELRAEIAMSNREWMRRDAEQGEMRTLLRSCFVDAMSPAQEADVRLRAAVAYHAEAYGRPATTGELTISRPQSLEELQKLSDSELAALVDSGERRLKDV